MIAKTIASAALAATLLASGIAAADVEYKPLEQDPEKLVFGFISTESSSNLKAQWQPMIDDMEK
ncbi:MAG: phosphonate ABC transporter substrate-binding protein, partial [Thalassospira sp.]